MIDEAFHLTPLDVRRYDFGRAFRGYDPARVDQFRDQVAEEMERLSRVNQDLDAKARSFHEQLRSFRERDKALNDALVSAQQLRAEMREQAEREAQLIVREAQGEADKLVDQGRAELKKIEGEMEGIARSQRAFITQMRGLISRQLSEIDAADGSAYGSGHGSAPRKTGTEEG